MSTECVVDYNRHSGRKYRRQQKNKQGIHSGTGFSLCLTNTCLLFLATRYPETMANGNNLLLAPALRVVWLFIIGCTRPQLWQITVSRGAGKEPASRHVSRCYLWASPLSSFPGMLTSSGKLEQPPDGSSRSCSSGKRKLQSLLGPSHGSHIFLGLSHSTDQEKT